MVLVFPKTLSGREHSLDDCALGYSTCPAGYQKRFVVDFIFDAKTLRPMESSCTAPFHRPATHLWDFQIHAKEQYLRNALCLHATFGRPCFQALGAVNISPVFAVQLQPATSSTYPPRFPKLYIRFISNIFPMSQAPTIPADPERGGDTGF